MANKNQGQRRASSSSWQSRQGYRNQQRDWNRQDQDSGQAYENDHMDRNDHRGNSYETSDRDYNHDVRSGLGTGSYHGGSYEGGYSNSDYRDNDMNQDHNEGRYSRRNDDRDQNYDYDRGSSRDYNQSRHGQASTYGMYGNQGTSGSYNTGTYGSGGSHFSSDYDRYNRGQVGSSFNRNTEGSSRWGEERQWGQTSIGGYRGKGPKGYQRSDERIREDINDRLSDSDDVDATDIEVTVTKGEVTLTGTVNGRREKRRAEDIADSVSGVRNVENRIRLQQQGPAQLSDDSNSGRSGTSKSTQNGNKSKHSSLA